MLGVLFSLSTAFLLLVNSNSLEAIFSASLALISSSFPKLAITFCFTLPSSL